MIDRSHDLPITKQAKVLNVSRGSVYYLPRPPSTADLALMRRIDELHLDFPFAGSSMLRDLLIAEGFRTGRRHVATLMKRMGPFTASPTLPSRRRGTRSIRISCAIYRSHTRCGPSPTFLWHVVSSISPP